MDKTGFKGFFSQSRNIKIIIIGINLLILIILAVLLIQKNLKTSQIYILVAPSTAKIEVGGETFEYSGTYKIKPGQTVAKISADGFESKTVSLNLESGSMTKLIDYLAPEDGTMNYYKEHKTDYEILEKIPNPDKKVTELISEVNSLKTIYNYLPIANQLYKNPESNFATGIYKISNGSERPECAEAACLLISVYLDCPDEDVNASIEKLGYSPDDYQLIYERIK